MGIKLEIISFNIRGCKVAQEAGADRIELCASPGEGGTTPSNSLIKAARKELHIPLYAMIRPRGGDFLYSEDEFCMMCEDVQVCKKLGCDGLVIGMLDKEGNVDKDRCARLVELAYPLGVTFHRAFDRVKDYKTALRDVISIGCERILTSGLHPSCIDGIDIIKDLIKLADRDVIIMPGSGVRPANIAEIVRKTKAAEIHSSASAEIESDMVFTNRNMNEALQYVSADREEVRKMKQVLRGL